jgi:hypothetical protein
MCVVTFSLLIFWQLPSLFGNFGCSLLGFILLVRFTGFILVVGFSAFILPVGFLLAFAVACPILTLSGILAFSASR